MQVYVYVVICIHKQLQAKWCLNQLTNMFSCWFCEVAPPVQSNSEWHC